jgi:hypothetical protein
VNTVLAAGTRREIKERMRKGRSNGVFWVCNGVSQRVLARSGHSPADCQLCASCEKYEKFLSLSIKSIGTISGDSVIWRVISLVMHIQKFPWLFGWAPRAYFEAFADERFKNNTAENFNNTDTYEATVCEYCQKAKG